MKYENIDEFIPAQRPSLSLASIIQNSERERKRKEQSEIESGRSDTIRGILQNTNYEEVMTGFVDSNKNTIEFMLHPDVENALYQYTNNQIEAAMGYEYEFRRFGSNWMYIKEERNNDVYMTQTEMGYWCMFITPLIIVGIIGIILALGFFGILYYLYPNHLYLFSGIYISLSILLFIYIYSCCQALSCILYLNFYRWIGMDQYKWRYTYLPRVYFV